MRGRDRHIPTDRLTALAFSTRAPREASRDHADDVQLLDHVSRCDACAERLAHLTLDADTLRDAACAHADEVFDDGRLEAQRSRILDRLAHLGQTARVISFPRRTRDVAMPVSSSGRRWISVAAAAGLIIGLVAGQLLHFVPSARLQLRDDGASMQAADRFGSPTLLPAALPLLTDDELMEEVEAAVQVRRAQSLRAIDALTPTAADILALGR